MNNIAIIIVNYGDEKNTIECIESITKTINNNYLLQIIIVDNNLKKESLQKNINQLAFHITNPLIKIHIIEPNNNIGFTGGNNIGIQIALKDKNYKPDYVLILNNDTIIDKNLLYQLSDVMENDKTVGITVPKIYFAKGQEFHRNRYSSNELGKVLWYAGGYIDWNNVVGRHRGVDEVDNSQYNKIEDTEIATGCCMLIKRKVFEKVGLFDERYFLYYEDSDFSMRVKEKGYKILYVPFAYLWHKNASSSGGSGSDLQDYYITRNRLLFGMKYASFKQKIHLLKESLSILARGRKWQQRGVLDFYFGRFEKGSFSV